MTPKKILIATGIYPPDIGGPATYSKLLADELPKHGIEVMVLTFGAVRHLPKVIRHLAYFFKTLSQGREVDIIYAQDPVSVGLPALWAARLLRKRFLLRLGGDYAWEQGVARFGVKDTLDEFVKKYDVYPLSVRMLKKIQTYVAQHAETVIVPSRYLASIVQVWGRKINVKVIHNAFSLNSVSDSNTYTSYTLTLVPESKDELRKKLNFQGKVILSAGRFVPWKGFDMLIEIMPDLRREVPDAFLYIVGEGPEQPFLKTLVEKHNASEYIHFLGTLPRITLLQYIKASDVFALNTGYEGLSHQLIEAMSLHTPVVTTNIPGNKELIRDGISGILLSYNDKKAFTDTLIRVLSEFDTSEIVNQAFKISQTFTYERMIKETIDVLNI